MSNTASTLHNFKQHAQFIEQILTDAEIHIDYLSLGALLRLRDLSNRSQDREWFMQSEFAALNIEQAINSEWVERRHGTFDWHPQKIGTFYYRLSQTGEQLVEQSLAALHRQNMKIIY